MKSEAELEAKLEQLALREKELEAELERKTEAVGEVKELALGLRRKNIEREYKEYWRKKKDSY